MQKSRRENAGQPATIRGMWGHQFERLLHVHSSQIVAQKIRRNLILLTYICLYCFGFVSVSWLICYNICSPWELRGQLIETTLNLLILSQIKRRFINTHRHRLDIKRYRCKLQWGNDKTKTQFYITIPYITIGFTISTKHCSTFVYIFG